MHADWAQSLAPRWYHTSVITNTCNPIVRDGKAGNQKLIIIISYITNLRPTEVNQNPVSKKNVQELIDCQCHLKNGNYMLPSKESPMDPTIGTTLQFWFSLLTAFKTDLLMQGSSSPSSRMVFKPKDINRLICVHSLEQIASPAYVTWATSQEGHTFLKQLPLGFNSDLHIKVLPFPPVTHLSEGGIQLDCESKLIQYRPGNASHLTDGSAGAGRLR